MLRSSEATAEHNWASPATHSATAQGDGTTYYYIDVEKYKYLSIQIAVNTPGATGLNTFTIEATAQNDGTAEGSCVYKDVTNNWFGSASYTAVDLLERDTPMALKYVRIKVVRTGDGAALDGAWTIYSIKRY